MNPARTFFPPIFIETVRDYGLSFFILKIIIAREVNDEAKLVIANQPTRGLDIGATEFVRQTLMDVRNSDRSVLLISADLEEILALSDRIAVMFGGSIAGILERKDANVQKIGLLMGGVTKEDM